MVSLTEKRKKFARDSLRRQVDVIRSGTPMAEAALPLHKSVYTSQKRYEAEQEHIFLNQPLVACLSGDLPEKGSRILFDAAGPSIIVSRGQDGKARAFLNMCPHRGAKLIEASEPWSGKGKKISCPFHAWTFDTSGNLVGQPGKAGFADCPIGDRDLIELPCTEYLGLVFVRANPDGDPIDAKAHLGDFAERMELLDLGKAEPVKKGILHADSNWKFALDTYGESYHFSTLHKSTIAKVMNYNVNYNDKCVFEEFGHHYRVEYPKFYIGDLVDKNEKDWPETIYSGVHFLFPNTVIYFGAIKPGVFFTQVFRLFPDGVGKTKCHFTVYAPFGVEDEEHREDYRVASNGYANLLTAPKDFHIVIGANEIALHGVHKNIAKVIGMPLAQIE